MGVRGLTSFINNKRHLLYEQYVLHDIDLIIDGCSLMCQLYDALKNKNCMFTGDYSGYAKCVKDFFSDLLRCKIRPIVIIDGGWENRKLKTIMKRLKDRIKFAANYEQLISNKVSVIAYFTYDVFIDIMKKMNINFVVCFFEADNHIVSLSALLTCPILSYDSDFYIYGSEYIPINTLDPYIIKISNGYGKRCQIYCKDNLLKLFRGLTELHLPIISILLGNDYISKHHFKYFISKLRIKKRRTNLNNLQRKIFTIFNWTKQHSVEELIEIILYHIKPEKRQFILEKIENIINMYFTKTVSKKMLLVPLGIDENLIADQSEQKVFNFQKDINNLKPFDCLIDDEGVEITELTDQFEEYPQEEYSEDDKSLEADSEEDEEEVNEDEKEENEDEKEEQVDDGSSIDEINFANLAPEWFQDRILHGDFCSNFINIITHRKYLTRIQIEDVKAKSSHKISFSIIRTICSLLLTRKNSPRRYNLVRILIRKKKRPFWLKMRIPRAPVTLEDLNNWDLNERVKLFNKTLEISGDEVSNFPKEWQLYIIAILFWMRDESSSEDHKKNLIHLNAIILTMLSRVIKENTYKLTKYASVYDKMKFTREKYFSIKDCFYCITTENSYSAALFFKNHSSLSLKQQSTLYKTYSPQIIHTFSQFQSVLKHTMDLNNLLGFIYQTPSIDKLFNGTMMYNFYTNLSTRQNICNYVFNQLQNSPPILYLYETLYNSILKILENVDEGEKKLRRNRRRNRRRNKKLNNDDNSSDDDYYDAESDCCEEDFGDFYDPSNKFCQMFSKVSL